MEKQNNDPSLIFKLLLDLRDIIFVANVFEHFLSISVLLTDQNQTVAILALVSRSQSKLSCLRY